MSLRESGGGGPCFALLSLPWKDWLDGYLVAKRKEADEQGKAVKGRRANSS